MTTEIWVNLGSDNGLLPDGTKPLPEPMLTDDQWSPHDIHIRAISQEMPQPSITEICLKITYLNFHSDFPGASELMSFTVLQIVLLNVCNFVLHILCNGKIISNLLKDGMIATKAIYAKLLDLFFQCFCSNVSGCIMNKWIWWWFLNE